MNYPKPVMKATELEKMGFPREFLLYAFRRKGQTYAWKMNPAKPNSTIVFDRRILKNGDARLQDRGGGSV